MNINVTTRLLHQQHIRHDNDASAAADDDNDNASAYISIL